MAVSRTSLTIDEKRQVVYSSLLRYASEAVPLRERALDRVVLGALIGSNEAQPYRLGKIQENLSFGSVALSIRAEVIQETLNRLIGQDKVQRSTLRERNAYYVTSQGEEELGEVIITTEKLFDTVIQQLLKNTAAFLRFDIGAAVFRKFLFECFARFGRMIAKNVTGTLSHDELIRTGDVRVAFDHAIEGKNLNLEQVDSLRVRCFGFLKSSDPNDEKLKFYLTQGYYFTQLLGLDEGQFNPLAERAFVDSIFYLDTNVLIAGLLYDDDAATLFAEVVRLAQSLGIELRVTRATINEAHRVISDRIPELRRIIAILPDELAQRTNDQILEAFLRARERNPQLTPEEFMRPFNNLSKTLRVQWNIVIDNRTEEEIIDGRDFSDVTAIMREEALNIRGWTKSEQVLKHDVCHYALVLDERCNNPKVWFLTRDRSLETTASRLEGLENSFCFSLLGFLQSISPFVTTSDEEYSFADVFSAFLADQIRPVSTLFEIRELALMAEFHEDVMATPPDQLVMAFDYIKSRTLQGRPYKEADIPRVSLELRKFLASDKDEQLRALRLEQERLANESRAERERRLVAEAQREEELITNRELREEMQLLRETVVETQRQVTATNLQLAEQQRQSEDQRQRQEETARIQLTEQRRQFEAERQRNRAVYMVFGFILGSAVWILADVLTQVLDQSFSELVFWNRFIHIIFQCLGAAVFVTPAVRFIRHTAWRTELQMTVIIALIAAALSFSQLLDKDTLSGLSDLISVATLLATLIFAALVASRKE